MVIGWSFQVKLRRAGAEADRKEVERAKKELGDKVSERVAGWGGCMRIG